jgi:hypothetical protein
VPGPGNYDHFAEDERRDEGQGNLALGSPIKYVNAKMQQLEAKLARETYNVPVQSSVVKKYKQGGGRNIMGVG